MKKSIIWILLITLIMGCNLTDKEPLVTSSPTSHTVVSDSVEAPVHSFTATPPEQHQLPDIPRGMLGQTVSNASAPNSANTPNNIEFVNVEGFLFKYGWTVTQVLGHHQTTLPFTFLHLPGDFPVSIYWAYNNVLSSAIGLNFEPFLGKQVNAIIYSLEETSPCLSPYTETRGIVLTSNGELVGAWIDSGSSLDKSCSLDNKSFQEITGLSWEQWLVKSGIVDKENELENKIAKMSPIQIVHGYYDAINDKNYDLAYAYLSREELVYHLFANLLCCTPTGEGELFHSSYEESSMGFGIENIKSVNISEVNVLATPQPDEILLEITGTIQYYKESPPLLSGELHRFITLEVEIDGLGFRISSIGTGP